MDTPNQDIQPVQAILAAKAQGTPMASSMINLIKNAASNGGPSVVEYFNIKNFLNEVISFVNGQGDAIWKLDTDTRNGQKLYYAPYLVGSNTYFFMVQYTLNGSPNSQSNSSAILNAVDSVSLGDPSNSTFTYEGKDYDEMGIYSASIANGEDNLYSALHRLGTVSAIETPIAGLFAGYLSSELKGIKTSLKSLKDNVDAVVGESAEETEAIAATTETELAFDTALSCASGAMIGLGLLSAAVRIFDDFILHTTAHRVEIHNLSKYTFAWSEPYLDHGSMTLAPAAGPSQPGVSNYLIPGVTDGAPPFAEPQLTAHFSAFQFEEKKALWGVGWGMNFELQNADQSLKGAIAYSIPYSGKNGATVLLGDITAKDAYQSIDGNKSTLSWSAQNTDSKVKIEITIDFLEGEHKNPSGKEGYFYQSVIVISDLP